MSSDFLKQMREIGDKHGQQGGASFITRMSISFGFWAYGGQEHDRLKFWKRCENIKEAEAIKAELQARLDEAGVDARLDYCLRVWASGKWLGRDEKEWDDNQFHARWQWDKKNGIDTCASLIFDSMEQAHLPVGEEFWGRYILKSNPYHVNLGEAGKKEGKDGKMYWPNFILPVEKFANEEAAKAAVASTTSDDGDVSYNTLSDKAKGLFNDIGSFLAQASQVQEWHGKVLKGEEVPSYPVKEYLKADGTIDAEVAKIYIADVWKFEVSDVDILLNEIPF